MSQVADLSSLVPGLKAGRADAYRNLVQVMGEPLLRYAATILKDAGAAEDVVQDALLRVYRMRSKLQAESELRGLCFRMVRNLARNHLRDRALRSVREQEAGTMRDTHSDHSGSALALEAWNLVAGLARDLREVVELRFRFGLSRSEIATALEVPEGTVATRQRTALETLRQRMLPSSPVALGIPQLAQLLADPAALDPSAVQPLNIAGLEDSLMAGITKIRRKAAGLAVAALLVALLVSVTGVTAAVSMASSTSPTQVAATYGGTTGGPVSGGKAVSSQAEPSRSIQPGRAIDAPRATDQPAAENGIAPQEQQPEVTPADTAPPATTGAARDPAQPGLPAPLQLAPQFRSEPGLSTVAGEPYEYLVQLAGTPAPQLTSPDLPHWLNMDGLRLYGTATRKDTGFCVFTLLASNGVSPTARQTVKLAVNAAPVFKNSPTATALAGSKYSFDVVVEAQPAATLTLANAPAWLSLTGGTLSGTPALADAGVSPKITLTASNSIQPDASLEFTMEVNASPVFTSAAIATVKVGGNYSYKVSTQGYPAAVLDASGLPRWLTFSNGELSGSPRNADLGKSKKITLRARNGIKPDAEQTFSIDVQADPDYAELPWDVDDMKKFIKVGLKWKLKGTTSTSDSMGGPAFTHDDADNECEITAVDKDGFTLKSTFDTGISVSGTTVTRTTDSATETIKWADAMAFARRTMPKNVAATTTRKETSETLTLLGKSYKCTVYTWTENLDNNIQEVRSIYYCPALPFGAVHYVRQLVMGQPGTFTNTDTFTQTLALLVVPKK